MGQQPRTRPFVAAPDEWEVVSGDDFEAVAEPDPKTWSDRLGLHEPTTSPLKGFALGAGTGLVDLVQGAIGNVTQQMRGKQTADQALVDAAAGRAMPAQSPAMPVVETPKNLSGTVGSLLPAVGEAMIGGPPVVKAGVEALPSAARAGAKFEQVMGAAGDIPVDVEATGKSALRIMDLAERGGTMPKAVRDLLKRVTDPEKGPMVYRESRDFASNLGKLSVDEMNRLKPIVKRQVAQMAADLNLANANAAKAAGKGAEYKSAMREYASAMRMRDTIDAALKHSKKAALGAAGLGGAAYWLNRD